MAPARTGRLAVFYVVLAVIVAAVVIVVIDEGKDEKAQPSIAGGYDTAGPNACLGKAAPPTGAPLPATAPTQPAPAGPAFDVKQSGQFVNLSNIQGTLGGKLRLHTESSAERPPPHRHRRLRERKGPRVPRSCDAEAGGGDHGHARRCSRDRDPQARPARSRRPEATRAQLGREPLQALAAVDVLRRLDGAAW